MAWMVARYRRAQREVSLSLERRRRIRAASFNLNAFSTQQSLSLFRFSPVHIGHLVDMLQIDVDLGEARLSVTPIECLCLVLRRLSSPSRWGDLEEFFGRSSTALCIIFYATVEGKTNKWGHLLTEWRVDFVRARAPLYSARIEAAGAYLDKCVGFIDETAIFVSRPGGGLQRACYSGRKRRHAVKFQGVLTPDGLFVHLFGPLEGRRHDMTLYYQSGRDELLPDALMVDGTQHYLYGDAAYMIRPWLQAAFTGTMTPEQEDANETMKVPRAAVEWGYKDVKQTCSFLDFPRRLKLREGPVGLLYCTAALIWNMRCCTYGGATSTFFKCPPPALAEYLGLGPVGDGAGDDGGDGGGGAGGDDRDGGVHGHGGDGGGAGSGADDGGGGDAEAAADGASGADTGDGDGGDADRQNMAGAVA